MTNAATPKAERRRLAKAELLLALACTAQRWANEVTDQDGRCRPFAEWPPDDPLRTLCRTYDLRPADLGRVLTEIADEVERRAMRAGYDDHWDEVPA